MRFTVLGPVEVWTSEGRRVRVPEVKVRALLADLLIYAGQPVPADRLIDDLWGDDLPARPAGVLRTKISQLRRVFEDAEPGGRALIEYHPAGYALSVEADAVDAHRFESLTAQARASEDPRTRAALLDEALALWRGAAYSDIAGEPFATAAVARLEEQRLTALEDHAEVRLELGEARQLAGDLAALVTRHPLRERLRAAHLGALYRSGRQSEALEGYRALRDLLRDELGVEPGPDLVALHRAILNQDPSLDAVPSPTRPRTNVPTPLTELIGRTEAVAEARARLESGRLVTLTGPGGVGKTRLALEVAAQVADEFPDGVHLIELTSRVSPPVDIADLVAAVLGIRDDAGLPGRARRPIEPIERLTGALRTKRVLLVLDNCEHVIEPAAETAESLLKAAPELRILATSREPLAVPGELLQTVPPLEPPAPLDDLTPEALRRSDAVRLFVARAAAAAPGFALDAGNAAAVAAICRRLDGIPLALELAATRVRALGVHELAARLDDRFRLLASGHRGVPPRQQTLRAVIDWSWALLTEAERVVLRRLAVHADGCTLEAAEVVCAGDGVSAAEVPELLARLVDRSLVATVETVEGIRYRLLESVAAYCIESLREVGEHDRVRKRHDHYYTDLAERADRHLRGAHQGRWLRRLDAETANLRAALDGAAQRGDAPLALQLVNAMTWYWYLRGRLGEARRSLNAALTVEGDAPPHARAEATAWQGAITKLSPTGLDPTLRNVAAPEPHERIDDPGKRARARWFLASALQGCGDLSAGENLITAALSELRTLGDQWGVAAALSTRARQAASLSDLDTLGQAGRESLALFRDLGDRWGQSQAMGLLGILAETDGDYERAARLHLDALRIAEDLELWPDLSHGLSGLGRLALLTGEYARAEELHERARRLAVEQSDTVGQYFAELGLGRGARRQGRLDAAETYLRNWLDWSRAMDWGPKTALLLAELGFLAEQRGDAETALKLHLDGFTTARGTGNPAMIALALEGMAGAHTRAGRPTPGARLLGAAAELRESAGTPVPPTERADLDRITTATREALGEEPFTTELRHGTSLTPDAAVHHQATDGTRWRP